jgi:hypothetical protein
MGFMQAELTVVGLLPLQVTETVSPLLSAVPVATCWSWASWNTYEATSDHCQKLFPDPARRKELLAHFLNRSEMP